MSRGGEKEGSEEEEEEEGGAVFYNLHVMHIHQSCHVIFNENIGVEMLLEHFSHFLFQ